MKRAFGQIVDLSIYSAEKLAVSVAGNELPLKIGDKILLPESSQTPKTVTSISVFDDGRVVYQLEWFSPDEGQFQNQAVTFNELMLLMSSGSSPDGVIGFGQIDQEKPESKQQKRSRSKKNREDGGER